MIFSIGDRVIVTQVIDETDEDCYQAGDYGRVISFEGAYIHVKFKRCLDMDGNVWLGKASYFVEPEALMKCKKKMTWAQIKVIADIIGGG